MWNNAQVRRQWPAALLFLAGGLKSGLTIDGALTLLLREAPEPLRSQLNHAVGPSGALPLAVRVRQAIDGPDLALPRAALLLSHRAGGKSAPVLERCARTLQAAIEMEDRLRALTAQNRISAGIIAVVPFALLMFFTLVAPDYVAPLFKTRAGTAVLVGVGVMITAGLALVRRMARLE